MFTPGLAIFYLATILRFSHACGVRTGFSNILSAGGSTLVPGYRRSIPRPAGCPKEPFGTKSYVEEYLITMFDLMKFY